jgi:glycosyltransferase involved in cell wall biosynthesis
MESTIKSVANKQTKYRILMTADLSHFPVPPLRYGATERAVATYSNALCARGHTVDLIAKSGSTRFNGELYTPPNPSSAYWSRAVCKIVYQPVGLWAARHADVVHCHSRLDYPLALYKTSKPLVVHFHNDARQADVDWLLGKRRHHIRMVAISHAQINHIAQKEFFDVVYSVLPFDQFPFRAAPDTPPYLVYLGRINYNKGADIAIQVAKRAGLPLKIVGPVRDEPGNEAFYREKVAPFLGPECVHLGEVTDEEKLRILSGATAMVFPMRWKEPMGLVMIESLACGTPVIVSNQASAPELVTHGKTGFLCDGFEEFVSAVNQIGRINRTNCRLEALARFNLPEMINQIERVYARANAG